MEIFISSTNNEPIYAQIYTQIRQQILSGKMHAGDALPSIRALAKDLRVSVITTKRAYEKLEQEGLVDTVAGKGCFVAKAGQVNAQRDTLQQLRGLLRTVSELAAQCGLSDQKVFELYQTLNQGGTNE